MESRLHRWSSIYSRLKGLLEHGGMRNIDQPMWYHLYERFPPLEEPTFGRPIKNVPIINIFYPEDNIRAKIHKTFHKNLGPIDLSESTIETNSQMWIKLYQDEISAGAAEEDALKKIQDLVVTPVPSQLNIGDLFCAKSSATTSNENDKE